MAGSSWVTDRDGRRGRIEDFPPAPADGEAHAIVSLEDGRRIAIPASALRREEDGNYALPLRLSELEATPSPDTPVVIPVVEEQLAVRTRTTQTGGVRIRKTVHTREEQVDEAAFREDVEVEHVRIDKIVDKALEAHYDGDTLVLPLHEEILVLEKRLLLREELRIRKRRVAERTPQRVLLRSEEAVIEAIAQEEHPAQETPSNPQALFVQPGTDKRSQT